MAAGGQVAGVHPDIAGKEGTGDPLDTPELLRLLADSLPTAVFIKDLQGRYRLVNRPFERRYGWERAGVLGRCEEDLFPAEAVAEKKVIGVGRAGFPAPPPSEPDVQISRIRRTRETSAVSSQVD